MDSSTSPAPRADLPDWSTQTEEISGPLCGYNLRGLTEPRCPECGYVFEWDALTNSARKKHPYLFEHHPERNIRSLCRTVLGQFRPRRFWRSVRPEMPSDLRRLMIYGALVITIALFWMVLPVLIAVAEYPMERYRNRQSMKAMLFGPVTHPNVHHFRTQLLTRYSSLEAALDANAPPITSGRYWEMYRYFMLRRLSSIPKDWRTSATMLLMAWPLATLLLLQIFRATLREASIRMIHLQRTMVYSMDAVMLLAAVGMLIQLSRLFSALMNERWRPPPYWLEPVAFLAIGAIVLYRLAAAFALYLRFKHAVWTMLATQLIIVMCLMVAISQSQFFLDFLVNQWLRLARPMP